MASQSGMAAWPQRSEMRPGVSQLTAMTTLSSQVELRATQSQTFSTVAATISSRCWMVRLEPPFGSSSLAHQSMTKPHLLPWMCMEALSLQAALGVPAARTWAFMRSCPCLQPQSPLYLEAQQRQQRHQPPRPPQPSQPLQQD